MNMWKLNNIQLNKPWVKEEIKEEIRKYLVINENENTTHKTWDTKKVKLREVYSTYEERPQINNLMSYLKELEKEEQNKCKPSKKK